MRSTPLLRSLLCLPLALLLSPGACGAASTGTVEAAPSGPAIAGLAARIIEQGHYTQKPVTEEMSAEFLDFYLKMYDPARMFFLASDIAEFRARSGPGLAPSLRDGNIEPAYFIFNRFRERLRERVALADELIDSTFTFTSDETLTLDRSELPWPADDAEVRDLWRKKVTYDMLQEKLNKAGPETWRGNVRKSYARLLDNYNERGSEDVLQYYLTAFAYCYDPHSAYMAAPAEDNFDIALGISLIGIGVTLQQNGGHTDIVSIIPGGPAEKSGAFHVNDRIDAVAQGVDGPFVGVEGMRLDKLVQLIRGVKGTVVRIRLIPSDALDPSTRVSVALVRDKILLRDQQARAKIIMTQDRNGRSLRLGAIKLSSFYTHAGPSGEESAARDVGTLLEYLEKQDISGLILDLRDNGGGSLEEAIAVTGLFVGGGPVVQVMGPGGHTKVLGASGGGPGYGGPLLVLVSPFSASASEIVTAALMDYGRAVSAGGRGTFGKGTVQTIVDLDRFIQPDGERPGGVRLTISKFYRISGGSTQNRGVASDIVLPFAADHMDIGEASLPNALPYDDISPAAHTRMNYALPTDILRLRTSSKARVAASPEFGYVKEDIERYLKNKEKKAVSLNYSERLAERGKNEELDAARRKERAARADRVMPALDITLQDIEAGRSVIFSSSALSAPVLSSGTAIAAAGPPPDDPDPADVRTSSSSVEGGDYARAPAAEDFVLREAADILRDMVGLRAYRRAGN